MTSTAGAVMMLSPADVLLYTAATCHFEALKKPQKTSLAADVSHNYREREGERTHTHAHTNN